MHFHISEKVWYTLACFAAAFVAVMLLFIKRPDIVKSKNKTVRAVIVFALAFVPGVLAASICAKTIITVYENFIAEPTEIVEEAEEREIEENTEKRSEEDAA
jgi:uncharacterized membrane protein YqhA